MFGPNSWRCKRSLDQTAVFTKNILDRTAVCTRSLGQAAGRTQKSFGTISNHSELRMCALSLTKVVRGLDDIPTDIAIDILNPPRGQFSENIW